MKQNKDQTSVLIWAATAVFFLYILFRLKVLEDIGQAAYIPGLALLCLAAQIANHEQAAVALRKKSPNLAQKQSKSSKLARVKFYTKFSQTQISHNKPMRKKC